MVDQYRHPVGMVLWELPAGLLDVAGEPPVACAQRELAEEADLVAREWHVLADWIHLAGRHDEAVRIYLARGPQRGAGGRAAPATRARRPADAVRWAALDERPGGILAGRLHNRCLVVGVLAASLRRAGGGWGRCGRLMPRGRSTRRTPRPRGLAAAAGRPRLAPAAATGGPVGGNGAAPG